MDEQRRLKNDVLFCYDLELPRAFTPVVVDGEVESFQLCDVAQILALVEARQFKPNVVLVLADFLVRHGIITPEMPGFLPLVAALRQGDCC